MMLFLDQQFCLVKALALILVSSILSQRAVSQTIYATEFEEFLAGEGNWAGSEGWRGEGGINAQCQGIDQDLVDGLGRSAFLGFAQPSATTATMVRDHDFSPLSVGRPVVLFEAVIGIQDSSNGFRDRFHIQFRNAADEVLAGIEFRNNGGTGPELWRFDGQTSEDLQVLFIRGELQLFTAQVNFQENTWSAQIDGFDLFTAVPFHAGGSALDLGSSALTWVLGESALADHGDNFALVADWILQSVPTENPRISDVLLEDTVILIEFEGEPGFEYTLETATTDLTDWSEMIPDNVITDLTTVGPQNFLFVNDSARARFFRIGRRFQPPFSGSF